MSKGPGVWQRRLLAELEQHNAVILTDLLPRSYQRAQYVALHRAASVLHQKGQVEIINGQRRGRVWVCRAGYSCNFDQVPRLKRGLSVDTIARR